MTGADDSESQDTLVRNLGGTHIARACCALVALLLLAALFYGGVMVVENYDQIAV